MKTHRDSVVPFALACLGVLLTNNYSAALLCGLANEEEYDFEVRDTID